MNVNKIFLAGRLTRDPELRYTSGGAAVCNFGLAINRRWKSKEGEQKEEVCFVDCTVWQKRGELVAEHFRRGDPIFVEGHLELQQWEKDGERRSKHVVVVDGFEFVDAKRERQEKGAPKPQDTTELVDTDASLGLPAEQKEDVPF